MGEGDSTIEAQRDSAASMLDFLEKAQRGEMIPPDVIVRYANYFQDDLTLDNMPRMQLINMCKYMGIQPYGSDSFLRFQLRHKIRVLKEDDQRILWEGIDSLNKMELREACQERGMRSTGLSKDAYKRSLQQWLDLSVNKDLPISLLIMSRTFFLREDSFEQETSDNSQSISGLADALSGMHKDIVNEVILEVATKEEKLSDPDVRKIKLEVVAQQNELIRAEEEEREAAAAAKKKESAEKETVEAIIDDKETEPSETPVVSAQGTTTLESAVDVTGVNDEKDPDEVQESSELRHLSTEEMDAISHLITDDPVSKEREELERIKAAMKADDADDEDSVTKIESTATTDDQAVASEPLVDEKLSASDAMTRLEEETKESVAKMEAAAVAEAEASTKVELDAHLDSADEEKETDEVEDSVIARLQKRVESMVDKIEVQLSETKVKIGDKLHILDKDRDGIMTKEEMAQALQQVLRREISFDEAMDIASRMVRTQI